MLQSNSRQFQKSEASNVASHMILIVRFNRVKSLSDVLRDTGKLLPKRELTRQQETELSGISERCCNILEELDKTLDRYQELDSRSNSFGGKSRRVWKRLTWDPKDIDGFRSRITSNVLLLNTFLGQLAR
jgi:hypothetical protein